MSRQAAPRHKTFCLNKHALLAASVATAFSSCTFAADETTAADAPALAADQTMEEVVVTGFRGTLEKGRDLKRNAVGTQDSIVAEDIAQFPDLNLAESMQRIPGVTIDRDGGEGRRIALRGLSSNFSLVQLNGMEVLANSDTAMDSRGQGGRDRAFDFNLFASDLFNQITVAKSFEASQDEGGMAGNVELHTARPFDYVGFNAVATAAVGTNSLSNDADPRATFVISNTWDRVGALASVSYSDRHTVETGEDTYRWRKQADATNSVYGPGVTAEEEAAIRAGEIRNPRASARQGSWYNDQTRLGITSALQYKTDDFDVSLNGLYGKLDNDRQEYHINPRGNSGDAAYGTDVTVNDVAIQDGALIAGNFSNTQFDVESRAHTVDTDYYQLALDGAWQLSDRVKLSGLIGHQESELNVHSLKAYTETRGDFSFDYSHSLMNPYVVFYDDMTDASKWWLEEIDIADSVNKTENDTYRLDLDFELNSYDKLRLGAAYKTLENRTASATVDDIGNDYDNGQDYADELDDSFFHTESGNKTVSFAVVDPNAVLNSALVSSVNNGAKALSASASLADATNGVKEDTTNAYVQYDWDRALGTWLFRGNLGVRYYDTDTSTIYVEDDTLESLDRSKDGFLPAINLVLQPIDSVNLRLDFSRNITRPSYSDLSGAPTVTDEGGSLDVAGINPKLQPYTSDNLDLGIEWYYSQAGYVALGYYRKDLSDYIVSRTETMTWAEAGLPSSLLPSGYSNDSEVTVTRSENAESAKIQGVEISAQRDFDFLPAPLDHLGAQANYTHTSGTIDNYISGAYVGTAPFPDMSRNFGSATLYYETDVWGVRVSGTYRSMYHTYYSDGGDEDSRGFLSTTFLDMHAFYQLTEKLRLTVDGSNLSNQKDQQFSEVDGIKRLYNATQSGSTWYFGASYQF